MKQPYDEGVATHTGPESCAVACKGRVKNLIGWALVTILISFPISPVRSQEGAIFGRVQLSGHPPELVPLKVTKKNQELFGPTVPNQALIVSADKGIKNVVVSIENISGGKEVSTSGIATVESKGELYVPHVQAVTVGTTLKVVNSDPVLHVPFAAITEIQWELSDPRDRLTDPHAYATMAKRIFLFILSRGKLMTSDLDEPVLIHVMCGVHPKMSAFIWVMKHPYFAVTDEEGSFKINAVPPGRYRLRAWHEALGIQKKQVLVGVGGRVRVDFEFAAPPSSMPR